MRAATRLSILAMWGVVLAGAAGCVERRFVIDSDPPGAMVLDENDKLIGFTPVDKTFVYYGNYRFKLIKDGYETLVVNEKVVSPWFEKFLVDFVSESLLPINLRDVRRLNYKLCPAQITPPETLLGEATNMRARGLTIGVPLAPEGTMEILPGTVVVPPPPGTPEAAVPNPAPTPIAPSPIPISPQPQAPVPPPPGR